MVNYPKFYSFCVVIDNFTQLSQNLVKLSQIFMVNHEKRVLIGSLACLVTLFCVKFLPFTSITGMTSLMEIISTK